MKGSVVKLQFSTSVVYAHWPSSVSLFARELSRAQLDAVTAGVKHAPQFSDGAMPKGVKSRLRVAAKGEMTQAKLLGWIPQAIEVKGAVFFPGHALLSS
jgi:hypothetical protein